MEFLKEILWKPLFDWPMGTIIIGNVWILLLGLIILIGWGLFYLLDTSFQQINSAQGTLIDKEFIAEHTDMQPMMVGKTTMMMPVHHPDDWRLIFDINGKIDSISVHEQFYESIQIGDKEWLYFKEGRFSNKFYITGFVKSTL